MKGIKKLKLIIKESGKVSLTVYLVLRILVIVCLIRQLFNGNYENALMCVLALILFLVPPFVEKTFKIKIPTALEVIVFFFIYSATILGEINNFYGVIPFWDTLLHTLNGFLCASIGFSLIYILNENIKSFHLSPIFVCLVAFCFSMTIGVLWEFFEYSVDKYFKGDMQKDEIVYNINSVSLNEDLSNEVVVIDNIGFTNIYDENGNVLASVDGYLDIGINDTMKDLFVNFIGAVVFSIFGYLYIVSKGKYDLAGKFITKKVKS